MGKFRVDEFNDLLYDIWFEPIVRDFLYNGIGVIDEHYDILVTMYKYDVNRDYLRYFEIIPIDLFSVRIKVNLRQYWNIYCYVDELLGN